MPFKKGIPGNPNGRPKNALGRFSGSTIREYLLEVDHINDHGEQITKERAFLERMYELAMNGNNSALRIIWESRFGRSMSVLEIAQAEEIIASLNPPVREVLFRNE